MNQLPTTRPARVIVLELPGARVNANVAVSILRDVSAEPYVVRIPQNAVEWQARTFAGLFELFLTDNLESHTPESK